jgi:hypothetical protein
MARYFLGHTHHLEISEDRKQALERKYGGTVMGGMQAGQDPERADMVEIPLMFGGGKAADGKMKAVPLKKNGIAFGFLGHGFWHIGPGEYVDLSDDIPIATVRAAAPQLLTKAEALAAGLCNEDGSVKAPKAEARTKQ